MIRNNLKYVSFYSQPKVQNLQKVIKDLDGFTVKSLFDSIDAEETISGQVLRCESNYIIVKIVQGFEAVRFNCMNEWMLYTIHFFINRSNFKNLHHSLELFKEFDLHKTLINNEIYNEHSFKELDYSVK